MKEMSEEQRKKKIVREKWLSLLGMFLISSICAGYVIRFRIYMKPYQIKPDTETHTPKIQP